jgi:hypothetical protein
MSSRFRTATAVTLIALSLATGLAACSSSSPDGGSTPSASATDSPEVQTPVVVESADLDGQQLTATVGQFIDINVGDSDPSLWTVIVETPGVVDYYPGGPDGASIVNPGFAALTEGATSVTMTDGVTTLTFTITVTK